MKVAVTGKGGSGKTTISATAARMLARRHGSAVALDCDPNPTLGIALGLSPDELTRVQPVINALWDSGFTHDDPRPDPEELLDRYGSDAPDGVRLLLTGLIEPAPGRCVCCGSHATTRALFGNLSGAGRYVVADLEAGLTDLLWADPDAEDTMIVVAEPSAKSIEIAVRAIEIGASLKVARVIAVANRCRTDDDAERVAGCLGIEVVAIPEDPAVEEASYRGVAPLDHDPMSPAVAAIAELVDRLEIAAGVAR